MSDAPLGPGGRRLRVLVADDEPPARERLKYMLAGLDWIEVVGEAASGDEVLAKCEGLSPEVVLLDIQMPGLDGLATARVLAESQAPPSVIFTTAHDEHALAAFEARALDYLLKPIRTARLVSALERVERIGRPERRERHDETAAAGTRRHRFTAQVGHQVRSVPVREVRYLRADGGYVAVGHCDGELIVNDSLAQLADEFVGEFVRVHRKTLVAPRFVRGLERRRGTTVVVMDEGSEFEVSRRLLSAVKSRLYG